MYWCILEWHRFSWLQIVRVSEQCRVYGGGGTEDWMEKEAIFDCFTFFCMSLHTPLYGIVIALISCLPNLSDTFILKEMIELSIIWRPFFRALVVSWGFSTTASKSSASGSLITVSCSRLSLVDSTAWDQWISWVCASSNSRDPSEIYEPTQRCSVFCPAGWAIPRSY